MKLMPINIYSAGGSGGSSSPIEIQGATEIATTAGEDILKGDIVYNILNGAFNYNNPKTLDGVFTSSRYPYGATFSPDGTKFILFGSFAGFAKLYSIEDATVTYVSDIYADNSSTVLSNAVHAVAFSPDGTKFIIGGSFTGCRAKLYSIDGLTVTYVSDIYADNSSTTLGSTVYKISFTNDGTRFIVAGSFTGRAKLYTLTNTTVTYVSDIYADNSSTVLNGDVNGLTISANSTRFILGGAFTNRAKLYTLEGETVTFIDNIYANDTGTVLNSTVRGVSFMSQNDSFIVGGNFSNYCYLYYSDIKNVAYKFSAEVLGKTVDVGFADSDYLSGAGFNATIISKNITFEEAE
ncbi:hypothetical protein LJC10_00440 [Selenomonadales bacterium OttesenSCG-928-I06]|nr:hypothetical protein [Selenomonadales bacterium OttesenSCG-928-I06]